MVDDDDDDAMDDDCCVVARMIVGCFSNVCGCMLVRVTIATGAEDVSIELTAMATSASVADNSLFISILG